MEKDQLKEELQKTRLALQRAEEDKNYQKEKSEAFITQLQN